MAKFWLGTYSLEPPAIATHVAAEPLLASDANAVAIEVIGYDDGSMAVLLSTADAVSPGQLTCCIGFTNNAEASNEWRDRGFPFVDATIEYENGTLSVKSPYFARYDERMQYEQEILKVSELWFDQDDKSAQPLTARYNQSVDGPDHASPASWILRNAVSWELQRSKVKELRQAKIKLALTTTRCPSLLPFDDKLNLTHACTGVVDLPPEPVVEAKPPPKRASRADMFGIPAFRFDEVDVIGFRLDLREFGDDYRPQLLELIEPLNFHLQSPTNSGRAMRRKAITDFRYLPATETLIIELLRYGKMRLTFPESPLEAVDYQSQHELLVRVLVGRVDDDSAQARDPAVFVPAIFVDNPWSKVLGRDVQGFDKRMADFCTCDEGDPIRRLRPDGREHDGNKRLRPLADVARVSLVTTAGSSTFGPMILDLKYSQRPETDLNAFETIDLELALGSSSLSLTRWRQTDFADPEFRRSFARSAVKETLKGFRSIQLSPVGTRNLEKTWITGTFVVDDPVRIAQPAGVANLTLYPEPSVPGWLRTCELLGIKSGAPETLAFPAGSWYQMRCSMNLTIDNGLE